MYELLNNNLFNAIDDLFDLGFSSKPLSFRYITPNTKDMSPASRWKKDDNKYYITVRMVGINPDDVKVTVEDYGIKVEGESDTFGETYSQSVSLGIAEDVISNVKGVSYEVKNGMCRIELEMKEKEYNKIDVKRIK